ncbi:hypothetical protein BDV96DRAFT_682591 [Lophiotrema nucula]|uniref:Peptidase S54 rhomboid domain-containing protein n=1 Tax=Lophiotrema nucula TaxID=690887 RepID=A0A6A5ZNU6_9PLEO|nr:hypothetical protein BDV96DRAFT_682591 [Lophiotrema nucula]
MNLARSTQLLLRSQSSGARLLGSSCIPRPCQLRVSRLARWKHIRHQPNQRHKTPQAQPKTGPQTFEEPNSRAFEDGEEVYINVGAVPKVKYLRPAIFAVVVSAGFYTFLAYRQAKSEIEPPARREYYRTPSRKEGLPSPIELATNLWQDMNPISKVSTGIIGTCAAVHLTKFAAPSYWDSLWHMPARNLDYTLFTSVFVHSGIWHLGFNMWACYNFLLPTGYSHLFQGNPYHVTAYFLSTGVLSAYAQHLTTMFSKPGTFPPPSIIRSGGASGALLSFFAVFCMQYPNTGVGIVFVPFSIAASTMLPLVMAFDAYGMIRGYKTINFGHAAHLSGMLIGVAYSYLDGRSKIWYPLVSYFRETLAEARRNR